VALRLLNRKLTLLHRRIWPAVAALSGEIGRSRLAAITEEHTPSGKHETTVTPFPKWVPKEVLAEAGRIDPDQARAICARMRLELTPLLRDEERQAGRGRSRGRRT
jgi:hypothetical protein